jgi:hypothetical protein
MSRTAPGGSLARRELRDYDGSAAHKAAGNATKRPETGLMRIDFDDQAHDPLTTARRQRA